MTDTQRKALAIIALRVRQACNNSDHFPATELTTAQEMFFRTEVLPTLDTLSKESKWQTLEEKERINNLVRNG